MSKLFVIGVCGKPGAGKDTIGNHLLRRYLFHTITIKKPIEQAVAAIFGIDERYFVDRDLREQEHPAWPGWSVRKMLQGVGQSMRDLVGEHVWSKSWCARLGLHLEQNKASNRILVTDIRTPGDVTGIRDHVQAIGGNFFLAMVRRPGYGATTAGGFENHKLESYDLSPECDMIFDNNGTIESLLEKVDTWMQADLGLKDSVLTCEGGRISEVVRGEDDLVKAFQSIESRSIAVNPDGIFGDPKQLADLQLWSKTVSERREGRHHEAYEQAGIEQDAKAVGAVLCRCSHAYDPMHACIIRKCMHRNLHSRTPECASKEAQKWCSTPGVKSPLDGDTDGGLICCEDMT